MSGRAIDLNADLGEGAPFDAELLKIVTSASIACGGHAGDAVSMRNAIVAARTNNVRIGAHPSYSDRTNFGRTPIDEPQDKTISDVLKQLRDFSEIARAADATVAYVKPHGALYNETARNEALCRALYAALKSDAHAIAVMGMPGTVHEVAAREAGLKFVPEAFADRAYTEDGTLVPRSETGAVHADTKDIVAQALAIAQDDAVTTRFGRTIPLRAKSLCLHGDNQHALEAAKAIRKAFEVAGIAVQATE